MSDVSQSANIIGTAEAARILGWSLAKVKRETLAGRLPHQAKLDGRTGAYLFSRDTVEFIARTQCNVVPVFHRVPMQTPATGVDREGTPSDGSAS